MSGLWIAAGVSGAVAGLFILGGRWLTNRLRDSETESDNWETNVDLGVAEDLEADLAADEAEHVKAIGPSVEFVPDGFTCLGCRENPALPFTVWCAVCNHAAWASFTSPQQPIEWGQR